MKCNVSRDFCPGYRCNPIVCHSSMSRVGAQNMDKWIFPYREQNSFPTFPLLFRVRHGNWLIPAFALPSMDRGAWQATVCRVTKSWTWLKSLTTHTHLFVFIRTEGNFCIRDIFCLWINQLERSRPLFYIGAYKPSLQFHCQLRPGCVKVFLFILVKDTPP